MGIWLSSRNAPVRKLESDQSPSESLHSFSVYYSCTINMAIWSRKNLAFSKIETKWSCSNVYLSKKYGKLGSPLYLSLYTCEMWPAFSPCDSILQNGTRQCWWCKDLPGPRLLTWGIAPLTPLLLIACLHWRCLPNKAFVAVVSQFLRSIFLSLSSFTGLRRESTEHAQC